MRWWRGVVDCWQPIELEEDRQGGAANRNPLRGITALRFGAASELNAERSWTVEVGHALPVFTFLPLPLSERGRRTTGPMPIESHNCIMWLASLVSETRRKRRRTENWTEEVSDGRTVPYDEKQSSIVRDAHAWVRDSREAKKRGAQCPVI